MKPVDAGMLRPLSRVVALVIAWQRVGIIFLADVSLTAHCESSGKNEESIDTHYHPRRQRLIRFSPLGL